MGECGQYGENIGLVLEAIRRRSITPMSALRVEANCGLFPGSDIDECNTFVCFCLTCTNIRRSRLGSD